MRQLCPLLRSPTALLPRASLMPQQEKVVGCLVLEEFHRCYARLQLLPLTSLPFLPPNPCYQQEKVVGCLVLEEFHRCYALLQQSLPCPLFVLPQLLSLFPIQQEKVVGCLVLEEFHRCYARLQPSETVRGIVESTNLNMTLVKLSTAVYVDPPADQSSCSGCPPGRQISDCAARSIAMEILRRPSIEFTIASEDPSHPTAIADFFDPNRAPFMPPSAEFRAARCTEPAIKKLMATPGLMDAEPGAPAGPGTPGLEDQVGGAKDELVKAIAVAAEMGKEAIGVVEEAGRADAEAVERARRVLIACQQHEFAELLLLAKTQAMLHMRPSPAADFIRARALAHNPSFRMLPPVCYSAPIPPIPRQLFAKFFVVERECCVSHAVLSPTTLRSACSRPSATRPPSLPSRVNSLPNSSLSNAMLHLLLSTLNSIPLHPPTPILPSTASLNLAYCGLPKVACTSWRMWLRAMLHLPKPEDHFLAHSYQGSGLGDLSQPLPEVGNLSFPPPINHSQPYFACTSWRMWLRAMLHLPKPEDHFLAHSYEGSGLGDLSQKFTEKEATRAMTRRGLFKFTFVRNPFSRVVSTYLNKLVVTDAPDRTKGWGTRQFWNKVRE
ncbi:unnamed protein product [Closterium sp. Yama58-4]|nr:unnamed protein product [Closterium sp. Yama58-4]